MAVTFTAGTVMGMLGLILTVQLYTARKVPGNTERSKQNREQIDENAEDIEEVEETAEDALETAEDALETAEEVEDVVGGASA